MKIHVQLVLIGLTFVNLCQTLSHFSESPTTELKAMYFGDHTNIDDDHPDVPYQPLVNPEENPAPTTPTITSLELNPILQTHLVLMRVIQFYFPRFGAPEPEDDGASSENDGL